jgi:putative transposase
VARPVRLEFEGACYHVMSRGDSREAIFRDDEDRVELLRTLGQACKKTGWQIHAYCLMSNHFHLVMETPQPNLSMGMKWLLGTYTQRFNRRHKHWGHLFGGRYKAQLIDGRSPGYLRAACDYVHLNPLRARMVSAVDKLGKYPWSSYPAYRRPKRRPEWLRTDRLFGEHGLSGARDGATVCREFERRLRVIALDPQVLEVKSLRRGWKIGAEDFADWIVDRLKPGGKSKRRIREQAETDAARAERIVLGALEAVNWREMDLALRAKGDKVKVRIARQLREKTPMTRRWIAERLKMGSPSYVSNLLGEGTLCR